MGGQWRGEGAELNHRMMNVLAQPTPCCSCSLQSLGTSGVGSCDFARVGGGGTPAAKPHHWGESRPGDSHDCWPFVAGWSKSGKESKTDMGKPWPGAHMWPVRQDKIAVLHPCFQCFQIHFMMRKFLFLPMITNDPKRPNSVLCLQPDGKMPSFLLKPDSLL